MGIARAAEEVLFIRRDAKAWARYWGEGGHGDRAVYVDERGPVPLAQATSADYENARDAGVLDKDNNFISFTEN